MRAFDPGTLVRGLALLAAAAGFTPPAATAYTCSTLSVTPVTTNYDPAGLNPVVITGNWTFACTRQAGDPGGGGGFTWALGADDGLQSVSGQSYVLGPASGTLAYELYQTYPTLLWGSLGATPFTGTLNFGGVGTPAATRTASGTFQFAMPADQTPWPAAGPHTDTVSVTLQKTSAGGAFPAPPPSTTLVITVNVSATCQISVPPGNVDFTYTSFQTTDAPAATTFGLRCTKNTPYAISLDANPGPLLGLNYTLSLSPASSGTGNGLTQIYSIAGSIGAGQAGTCGTGTCSGTHTRTLTVTY